MEIKGIDGLKEKEREVVEKRLKVIEFLEKYGVEITKEAFNISKSTIYLWRKRLKDGNYYARALVPFSKAPKRKRQKEWNPFIVEFIKVKRKEYPSMGQVPITYDLRKYCKFKGIKCPSVSTVGRIIRKLKDNREIYDSKKKVTFYARSGEIKVKSKRYRKKLRRRGYTPKGGGDLVQIDSIVIFTREVKRYIITGIDIVTRFAFAYVYKDLSSDSGKDFMEKFCFVSPFKIKKVQTDNGGEFEKHFDNFLKKKGIIHYYNYPHRPTSNAYIERFNRTIKEHYINWHIKDIIDIESFNMGMMEYLIWYNTSKPHNGISNLSPLQYFIKSHSKNTYESNMLWDSTRT